MCPPNKMRSHPQYTFTHHFCLNSSNCPDLYSTRNSTHTKKIPLIQGFLGLFQKVRFLFEAPKVKKAHFPAFGQVLGSRSDPDGIYTVCSSAAFRPETREFEMKMYSSSNRFNTKSKQLCTPRWQATMAQNGIAKGGRQFDQ